MFYEKNLIKLSDSFSVLYEEIPNSKKKYILNDNEDKKKAFEKEMLFNDPNYKSYDQLFD